MMKYWYSLPEETRADIIGLVYSGAFAFVVILGVLV